MVDAAMMEVVERLNDVTRAVNDLIDGCVGEDGRPRTSHLLGPGVVLAPASCLTVLSRMVRDGCTYDDAVNGG